MAEAASIDNGGAALVAATAKTLIELSSGSTVTARIIEVFFGADPTTSGTLKVELISATSGTGTAYTPKRVNADGQNRAANATAKINDTVEPSSVTVLRTWMFPLPMGGFDLQFPLGREPYLPVSTMFGLRFTSSITANGYATLIFEE